MPRVKKQIIEVFLGSGGLGTIRTEVVFYVNAAGEFYCEVPPEAMDYFSIDKIYDGGVRCRLSKNLKKSIYSETMSSLEVAINAAVIACNLPQISVEHVICYNIESHVSFALSEGGDVQSTACSDGSSWCDNKMYGGHYAGNEHKGGYSLTVGAKAMTKTTTKVGERTRIKYERYNQEVSHFDLSKPASLLNSWVGFNLASNAKEIPYSDQAAMFFYNIMLGMSKLSKQVQEATFDKDGLLEVIHSGQALLGKNDS